MELLIDTFPTVYHTHHSDKQLKRNRENTPATKGVTAPFSKLLLIRKELDEAFNIRKMLHFNTNPTVYCMLNSDKRLKS